MPKEITLDCGVVKFCHFLDEEAFFDWIDKIPSISRYEYPCDRVPRNILHLIVKNSKISDEDLRSLIGLFYRWNIDMKQLRIFAHEGNKEWMQPGGESYWEQRIFD